MQSLPKITVTFTPSWSDIDFYINQLNFNHFNALALSQIVKKYPDTFSKCQLYSKFKLATLMAKYLDQLHTDKNIAVCGSWVGTQIKAIQSSTCYWNYPHVNMFYKYDCFDLDKDAIDIANIEFKSDPNIQNIVKDIYEVNYDKYDIIINPIIEHIPDTKGWLDLIPRGRIVAMTSTNYTDPIDHINVSPNMNHFVESVTDHVDIERSVILEFPIYERYIIIGKRI